MIVYVCKNRHSWRREESTICYLCGEPWSSMRVVDRSRVSRFGDPHFHLGTFKPYVEDGFDGKPRLIESREQRDRLCREHNLTYDRATNLKPRYVPATESIDLGDVKDAIESGKTEQERPEFGTGPDEIGD